MLEAYPMSLSEANEYINTHHRHHKAVHRDKYRVGVKDETGIHGVIQVGRPVSRVLDDGETLEVVRCCTDGTKGACSFLYSRAARVAKELGYKKIITYILVSEDGTSLKASGWKCENKNCGGGEWNRPSRPREKGTYPTIPKQRWEKRL